MKAVFAKVADASPAERESLLDELCEGEDALRERVVELLGAANGAAGFLERPAVAGVAELARALLDGDPEPVGRVGSYRIVRKIADGGMGSVYEAEQDAPRRRVALKLIRGHAATIDLQHRLRREAEALGRLQHSGIARIYDAGSTPVELSDGTRPTLPYIAMEFVDGVTLTRHADAQQLSVRDRLELLAAIAEAVHHAHQQGVIHRDLKPANILVTRDRQPKVLDFGVARLSGIDAENSLARTLPGQIIGTLAYMSPEQLEPGGTVDVRSDVYSLGVVAYELLGGRPPLDIDSSSIASAVRVIATVEPRGLGTISKQLRGDVATIVDHAIAKDPDRRYSHVAEFAADIRRHLANEPIHARPPSALYVARKFAVRHKGAVAAVAAILLLLAIGSVASAILAVRASNEALRARTVADFVSSMLEGVKPEVARTMDTSLLEYILGRTVERLDAGELGDAPAVHGQLRMILATTYDRIAKYDEAIAMYERAIELYTHGLGRYSLEVFEARNGLVGAHLALEQVDRAEALLIALRDDVSRHAQGSDADFLESQVLTSLGRLLAKQRRFEEAIEPLVAAVACWNRVTGPRSAAAIAAMNSLAGAYSETGRADESIATYEEVLEVTKGLVGEQHPNVAQVLNNLAVALIQVGRTDEARSVVGDAIAIQRAVLPSTHPSLGMSLHTRASLIRDTDLAGAERDLAEALRIFETTFPNSHAFVRITRQDLGACVAERGDFATAVALLSKSYDEFVASGEADRARATARAIAQLYRRWNAADPAAERLTEGTRWLRLSET